MASVSGMCTRTSAFRDNIIASILYGRQLEVSFDGFPYYLRGPTSGMRVCDGLKTLSIKDQSLTNESAEKVVGWALSHHLMTNPKAEVNARLVLSTESIQYGIGILQSIMNETKNLKMSLKDVVTENEFEKRLLADVIPPSDIGVTFDDIGSCSG